MDVILDAYLGTIDHVLNEKCEVPPKSNVLHFIRTHGATNGKTSAITHLQVMSRHRYIAK